MGRCEMCTFQVPKYPVMAQPECGDVFCSVFFFQHFSFHLLNTILSAEQVNILEREKFYITSTVLKKKNQTRKEKQSFTPRQTICSLSVEVQGESSAESLWKSLHKKLVLSQGMNVGVICSRSLPFIQNKRRSWCSSWNTRAARVIVQSAHLAHIQKILLLLLLGKYKAILYLPTLEFILKQLT